MLANDKNQRVWAAAFPPSVDHNRGSVLKLNILSEYRRIIVEIVSAADCEVGQYDWAQAIPSAQLRATYLCYKGEGKDFPPLGPGWVQYDVPVPPSVRGLLYARIRNADSDAPALADMSVVQFCAFDSSKPKQILIQLSDLTDQAYNTWGGQSYYPSDSCVQVATVPLYRPIRNTEKPFLGIRSDFSKFLEPSFVYWLARERVVSQTGEAWLTEFADVCTNSDIHRDPTILTNRKLLISVGHHEYWTNEMLEATSQRIQDGMNYANLGANTCWRRVTIDKDSNMILKRVGPGVGNEEEFWHYNSNAKLVDYMIFGESTAWGAVGGHVRERGYTVANVPVEEWAKYPFARLKGLRAGYVIDGGFGGRELRSVNESDSARLTTTGSPPTLNFQGYRYSDGRLAPVPGNVALLAYSRVQHSESSALGEAGRDGNAAVVAHKFGAGRVFSCGNIEWVAGLEPTGLDGGAAETRPISRRQWMGRETAMITRNVIVKLGDVQL